MMKKLVKELKRTVIMLLIISMTVTGMERSVYANEKTENNNVTKNVEEARNLIDPNFTVEDLPDELISNANIKKKNVKGIDTVDSLDLKSFTTVNSNNTKTVHIYNEPIKFYDKKEKCIKFIDSSLKESEKSKYLYENTEGQYKIFIPQKMEDYVLIEDEDKNFIKFKPNTECKNEGKKTTYSFLGNVDDVVEYKKIFGNGYDLQYCPQNNSVKENIIINKNNGKKEFDFIIETNGLVPDRQSGKIINFVKEGQEKDSESNYIFSFGELFIRDSYVGDPDGKDHISVNNSYKVTSLGKFKYKLSYILDEKFLNKKSTQYPVMVDPSISPITKIYDAPVYTKRSNENFRYNAWIQIGNVGGTYGYGRGYFKTSKEQIEKLAYINPEKITKASLRLYEGSGTTYTSKIKVFNNSEEWKVGSITYNNKPGKKGTELDTVKISQSGFYNFSITSLVKNWLKCELNEGGYSADYGVVLIRDADADGRKDFCSANYGETSKQPTINITYKEDTSISDDTYFITNYNSSKRLEAVRENIKNPRVVQNDVTSNDNQQWKIKYMGDGYYTLANRYYGTEGYLNVDIDTSKKFANIGSLNSGNKFKLIKNNDGTNTYRIVSKQLNDLKALLIHDASKEANVRVRFDVYNGKKRSQWSFKKVETPYNGTDLVVDSVQIPKCITYTTKKYSVSIAGKYITTNKDITTKIEVLDSENNVLKTINKNIQGLESGTKKKLEFEWNAPKKGDYSFRIAVDSNNSISETNENNNIYI